MAARVYIVPVVGAGVQFDPREPKYIRDLPVNWGGMDYGFQPIFLVGAEVTNAQHTSLIANSDVFTFPLDLDTQVGGGNVNSAKAALELALIPAQWLAGSMPWRTVVRAVGGMFGFMQRFDFVYSARTGQHLVLIDTAAKLNEQWSTIPVEIQQDILDTAASFSYDTSFITPTMQIRIVLQNFSDQFGARPIILGPVAI